MFGLLRVIYPDTTIWNRLLDEAVDPAALRTQLHERGLDIAYSSHVLYELSKAFEGTRLSSRQKAPELFRRFKSFLEQDFLYVRQNVSILKDEAKAADGEICAVQPFGGEEYSLFRARVERLSGGALDSQTAFAIAYRKKQVQALRTSVTQGTSAKLAQLARIDLEPFIRKLMGQQISRNILKFHLANLYIIESGSDLTRVAKKILRTRSYRVAHTFVKTDLFLTWRKERNGTLRRDAADDVYHLVNASYCDIYCTSDKDQNDYVPAVLPDVKFAYYDQTKPISDWLCGLSDN
jgi:hypothetical protein